MAVEIKQVHNDYDGTPEWDVKLDDEWVATCATEAVARAMVSAHNAEMVAYKVRAYNHGLNRRQLAPTGDDYNALLDIVAECTGEKI